MKKLLPLIALALCGCASFTTTQTDISTTDKNGNETRTITTKAKARTFFEAKSQLANFKASQTDKTQSASVGSLSQEASGSNVVSLAESIARGVAEGAAKGLK